MNRTRVWVAVASRCRRQCRIIKSRIFQSKDNRAKFLLNWKNILLTAVVITTTIVLIVRGQVSATTTERVIHLPFPRIKPAATRFSAIFSAVRGTKTYPELLSLKSNRIYSVARARMDQGTLALLKMLAGKDICLHLTALE